MDEPNDLWRRHARQWQWVGQPLRPPAVDIRAMERCVADWRAAHAGRRLRAVLLGVTPEIAGMHWPRGTRLIALDRSHAMITTWWAADSAKSAVCADWSAPPLPDGAHDIIIGDASLNTLPSGRHYPATVRALRRLLQPEGLFVMRFFVRPEQAESAAAVLDALHDGRIGNFHIFKWRLAMALHGSFEQGVELATVWRAWHAAVPSPLQLAQQQGWSREVVATMDAYRDSPARFTFPTLAELRAALAEAFVETACQLPAYELGERCPTLVLAPR